MTYHVEHICAPLHEHGSIVRELSLVDPCAIWQMGTIVDIEFVRDVAKSPYQVPRLLSEFTIGFVGCITGEPGTNVEVAGVSNS